MLSLFQIERSHRTWKTFLKYDILQDISSFLDNTVKVEFDWVTALPVYQHAYNTTYHKALGTSNCYTQIVY